MEKDNLFNVSCFFIFNNSFEHFASLLYILIKDYMQDVFVLFLFEYDWKNYNSVELNQNEKKKLIGI